MRFTPRDVRLFEHISKYNILTTKQIQEQIFPELELTTVLRRLRKLERAKYLKRLCRTQSGMTVWGNTNLAVAAFTGMPSASRVNLHTVHHDVMLTDVRRLLENLCTIKDWYDVRAIKYGSLDDPFYRDFVQDPHLYRRQEELHPDGLFLALKNGRPKAYALELELNHKSRERYERILRSYRNAFASKIPGFWSVTTQS